MVFPFDGRLDGGKVEVRRERGGFKPQSTKVWVIKSFSKEGKTDGAGEGENGENGSSSGRNKFKEGQLVDGRCTEGACSEFEN